MRDLRCILNSTTDMSSLPHLLLIADGFTDRETSHRVIQAVEAGARWVQLRDHGASPDTFHSAGKEIAARVRSIAPDVLISINARIDVAQELRCGFHTGRLGPAIDEARSNLDYGLPLGASVHGLDEAIRAAKDGVDYLIYSPIYETTSKPEVVPVGLDALAAVVRAVSPLPVFALGGISPERVRECLHEGAYGVAVLSGILRASDAAAATHAYLAAFSDPTQPL
jgi:thiamine-phosphate pyrophosphorylase